MKHLVFLLLLAAAGQSATAQQRVMRTGTETDISALSDEFSDTASVRNWNAFHLVEGFPDKIRHMGMRNGLLELESHPAGWYADYQAPFLFKPVTGNFDVTMRLRVRGASGDSLPATEWSLAGIMVREPKPTNAATWEPRSENWLFLTTGIADRPGTPVFESKTTANSLSNLRLRPARAGWVELRIIRVDASFILLSRYDGEGWQVRDRFYRPVLSYSLQVGLNFYSGFNSIPAAIGADPRAQNAAVARDVPTDMLVEVDYIRYARPRLNTERLAALRQPGFNALYYGGGNLLTDYSLSDEALLKLLQL
ncbi:MAG: hypothetical protein EOO11_16925 [Chitinophagaceae bacterium]|nr:MAG: hypothetical protein EOO11_16925 [Chitinophagaceae bacterium]